MINFQDTNILISQFHELNEVYDNQYSLYLDVDGFELFDMRLGKSVFRSSFKHRKTFTEFLVRLKNDIIQVGCIKYRRDGKPSSAQSWALKSLLKSYDETEISYFLN